LEPFSADVMLPTCDFPLLAKIFPGFCAAVNPFYTENVRHSLWVF